MARREGGRRTLRSRTFEKTLRTRALTSYKTWPMDHPNIAQEAPFVKKMEPGTYWWCACGLSKTQPFCDGSHKGTPFAPVKTEIKEAKTVAWCGCKHSK